MNKGYYKTPIKGEKYDLKFDNCKMKYTESICDDVVDLMIKEDWSFKEAMICMSRKYTHLYGCWDNAIYIKNFINKAIYSTSKKRFRDIEEIIKDAFKEYFKNIVYINSEYILVEILKREFNNVDDDYIYGWILKNEMYYALNKTEIITSFKEDLEYKTINK